MFWKVMFLGIAALAPLGQVQASEACSPAVSLEGDGALVERLEERLRTQNITAPAQGCPALLCQIRQEGEGLVLVLEDQHGRRSTRTVASEEMAVVVIESWVRDDLFAELLAPPPTQTSQEPPAPQNDLGEVLVELENTPVPRPEPPAPVSQPPSRAALGGALSTSVGDDGTWWYGGHLTACLRLGPLCVGGLLRLNIDTEAYGSTSRRESERTDTDYLASAEYALRSPRFLLAPGVQVGVRSAQTSLDSEETGGAPLEFGGGRFLVGASLRASYALEPQTLLELGLFVDVSPFAHTANFRTEEFTLTGEPSVKVHLGLGLRYGAQ